MESEKMQQQEPTSSSNADRPDSMSQTVNTNDGHNDQEEEPAPPSKKKFKVNDGSTVPHSSSSSSRNQEQTSTTTNGDDPTTSQNSQQQQQQPHQKLSKSAKRKKRREGKKKRNNLDDDTLEVRRAIQLACRDNNLKVAIDVYNRAKTDSTIIEPQTYYNLLNLCAGTNNNQSRNRSSPKEEQQEQSNNPISSNDGNTTSSHNEKEEQVGEEGETGKDDDLQNEAIHSKKQSSSSSSQTSVAVDPPPPSPPSIISIDERIEFASIVRKDMKVLNLPLGEGAYSALVKLLSKSQKFDEAETVLTEAEQTQQCKPKLRLYSSLLMAYCNTNQLSKAIRLWKRMVNIKKREANKRETNSLTAVNTTMDLTEREYSSLMTCATVCQNSTVMEFVLSELAEEVPVPLKTTVDVISRWFKAQSTSNTVEQVDDGNNDETITQLVQDISILQYGQDDDQSNNKPDNNGTRERPPTMGPVIIVPSDDNKTSSSSTTVWDISYDCKINNDTGELLDGCLKGTKLHPVPLSDRAFEEMKSMNTSIVFDGQVAGNVCQFQGGRKGKKRPHGNNNNNNPQQQSDRRKDDWRNFSNFLRRGGGGSSTSWDIVIDGANVGYYQQNYASAPKHVDYEKIDWIIRHFLQQSPKQPKILVVMHTRHFSRHMLPDQFRPMVDRWRRLGVLYQTPHGMNDDWFWMHAALEYKTLVVTNDEMRDHHFQMLAPRSFLRWKERHQVYFDFGEWMVDEQCPPDHRGRRRRLRQVQLKYPKTYSRRIQRVANGEGLVVPLGTNGGEQQEEGQREYTDDAFDEEHKGDELYLCIRPKFS